MELFFTDRRTLHRQIPAKDDLGIDLSVGALPPSVLKAFSDLSIPDGMPFFLNKLGNYEPTLSKFFRDIASDGGRSPQTWRAYARDIHLFSRFLDERRNGRHLLAVTKDDLRAYYRARCLSLHAISVRSWNRAVAALDRFYCWALEEELIERLPFDYRYGAAFIPGRQGRTATRSNQFAEPAGARDEVKCISLTDYLVFRDVGLLGRLPDGSPDPAFRGRNTLRNAAFAEWLVTTGTRLSEASSILKAELPDVTASDNVGLKTLRMQLARLTSKGAKGRTIRVPRRLMKEFILPYIQEDRDNAVAKSMMTGAYRNVEGAIPIAQWGTRHCRPFDQRLGTKVQYDALSPADRALMFTTDASGALIEPGLLWCTESGLPTQPENFQSIFERACERCSTFGFDFDITPHTLRHTFAVYMLSELIRSSVGSVTDLRDQRRHLDESVYRRILVDPLDHLRRLLGHRSITSTYIYLTYLEEAQEMVDQAVNSWSDRLGPTKSLPSRNDTK